MSILAGDPYEEELETENNSSMKNQDYDDNSSNKSHDLHLDKLHIFFYGKLSTGKYSMLFAKARNCHLKIKIVFDFVLYSKDVDFIVHKYAPKNNN